MVEDAVSIIRRTPPSPERQEEEESLLSTLGQGALSGIGMLGNVLDLPGSMIRDVVTFNNPFDQLLSPLSHENRATGRDVLSTYGLASENKETGWVPLEDPAEFAQDALGFGVELALDPLGWATGWTKAGRLAKAAEKGADVAKPTGMIRRGVEKFGDTVDKFDPGHRLGMAAYTHSPIREAIQSAGGKVGKAVPITRAAKSVSNWARKHRTDPELRKAAETPFPEAGEYSRVRKEAVDTFGPDVLAFMPVMEARARVWATEAAGRSPDDFFKNLQVRQSDISDIPDEALRQGEYWISGPPEFKQWFGNSKIVDEAGKPLRVYHGTGEEFTEFNPNAAIVSGNELGDGIYLTQSEVRAGAYAKGDSGNIMPLYARVENPLRMDDVLPESQREAISDLLSKDILDEDKSYFTSGPAQARFAPGDVEAAEEFFKSRMDHWEKHGEGYHRFQPGFEKDGDDWIIRYFDPDKVGIAEHGKDAVSQLRKTYGSGYTHALARAGIDGVVSADTVIVTDPTQIKSVHNRGTFDPSNPNILFQSEPDKAMWFSKLGRAIADMPGKMEKDQFFGFMRKKGVKQEELDWANFDELFPDGSVKPSVLDDALNFIRRNVDDDAIAKIELENFGYKDDNDYLDLAEHHGWTRPITRKTISKQEVQEWFADNAVDVKDEWYRVPGETGERADAVYGDYTTPGGQNYRNLLLRKTDPMFESLIWNEEESLRLGQQREKLQAEYDKLNSKIRAWDAQENWFGSVLPEEYSNARRRLAAVAEEDKRILEKIRDHDKTIVAHSRAVKKPFVSSHWGSTENVVAHLRMHDRVGPNGEKILHIDEIQSDWHQAGREYGYQDGGIEREMTAELARSIQKDAELFQRMQDASRKNDYKLANSLYDEHLPVIHRIRDLESKLNDLHQRGVPDGPFKKTWDVLALKRALREAAEGGYDKLSINSGDAVDALDMGGQKSGIDRFYNEVYVNKLNKLVKKHGAKVEKNGLQVGVEGEYAHILDITPELRKSVMGGQPLFQGGSRAERVARGAAEFRDNERIIHAFESADISTLAHESAHIFRRDLDKKLNDEAAKAIEDMIQGPVMDADGRWTVEAEEAFASGFERYMRDGKAPTAGLKAAFAKFRQWLTEIYQSLVGTPLEQNVSSGLRNTFDSMLTSKLDESRGGRIKRAAADAISGTGEFVETARTRLNEAFDNSVGGFKSAPVQQASRTAFALEGQLLTEYRERFVPMLDEVMQARDELAEGINPDDWATDMGRALRNALESPNEIIEPARLADIPPQLHEPLQQLKDYNQTLFRHAKAEGINVSQLEDEVIGHLHRQMSDRVEEWLRQNDPAATAGGSLRPNRVTNAQHQGHRHQLFKDGETNAFDDVVADAEIHRLLDKAHEFRDTDPEQYQNYMEEAARRIDVVSDGRIERDMKAGEAGIFVMRNSEGQNVSISASDLHKMEFDPEILVGDAVRWDGGGVWQIDEIITSDGTRPIPPQARLVDEAGNEQFARLEELQHWDDNLGDVRDTSRTRRVREEPRLNAAGEPDGKFIQKYTHEMKDRFAALADHIYDRPVYLEAGGLYATPFHSMLSGSRAAINTIGNARRLNDVVANGFDTGILQMPAITRGDAATMTLDKLFDSGEFSVMDRKVAYNRLIENPKFVEEVQNYGRDDLFEVTEETNEFANWDALEDFVGSVRIDPEIARDLKESMLLSATPRTAGVQGTIENAFRSFTSLFKAGVLTHPARYNRDFISGQIQNLTHGIFSFAGMRGMFNTLFNRPDEALLQVPAIQEFMAARKMESTAENATKAVRRMYAARRGHSSSLYHDIDNVDTAMDATHDLDQLRETLLGNVSGPGDLLREVGATAVGRRGGSWRPWDVAGFNLRRETQFAPVRAGELMGRYMDDSNRLVGFIESMRRGLSADEAMKIVDRVQLNYDPRTFTPTEQQLKRFFPFYSFFTRELKYLGTELLTNPTGRLGKLIRLQSKASPTEDGEYVPEHVREQMALPLGKSADGGRNYLTGLGLMHEDPIATVVGGLSDPQRGARNLISKMNPLVKGLAEYGLGRSSFQGGPLGGRDLHDMDPSVGRILTQLGLQDPTPSGQARPFPNRGVEFAVSNSPISRVVSSVKTAMDDRKTPFERILNLLTGVRITTVSPEQSRRALRAIGDAIARDAGSRAFSTFTVNDALIEAAPDEETRKKLRAVRRQRDLWNQERRRIKREAKEAKEAKDQKP